MMGVVVGAGEHGMATTAAAFCVAARESRLRCCGVLCVMCVRFLGVEASMLSAESDANAIIYYQPRATRHENALVRKDEGMCYRSPHPRERLMRRSGRKILMLQECRRHLVSSQKNNKKGNCISQHGVLLLLYREEKKRGPVLP